MRLAKIYGMIIVATALLGLNFQANAAGADTQEKVNFAGSCLDLARLSQGELVALVDARISPSQASSTWARYPDSEHIQPDGTSQRGSELIAKEWALCSEIFPRTPNLKVLGIFSSKGPAGPLATSISSLPRLGRLILHPDDHISRSIAAAVQQRKPDIDVALVRRFRSQNDV